MIKICQDFKVSLWVELNIKFKNTGDKMSDLMSIFSFTLSNKNKISLYLLFDPFIAKLSDSCYHIM